MTSTRRRSGLAAMRELFCRNDLSEVAQRIVSLTPVLTEHDHDAFREEEILQWLETRSYGRLDEVVLDDKPFTGRLAGRLVRTDPDHGLTWKLARFAEEMLK